MKYAVIRTGGKQYRVKEGDTVEVERLSEQKDSNMLFSDILFFQEDGKVLVGKPTLSDVTISAKVIEDLRGPKIRVAKFKAKARSRRVIGHRQALTKVQIEKITASGRKIAEIAEEKPVKESKIPRRSPKVTG